MGRRPKGPAKRPFTIEDIETATRLVLEAAIKNVNHPPHDPTILVRLMRGLLPYAREDNEPANQIRRLQQVYRAGRGHYYHDGHGTFDSYIS